VTFGIKPKRPERNLGPRQVVEYVRQQGTDSGSLHAARTRSLRKLIEPLDFMLTGGHQIFSNDNEV
jgi:hypothetical protein